jgi:hypothetical protein
MEFFEYNYKYYMEIRGQCKAEMPDKGFSSFLCSKIKKRNCPRIGRLDLLPTMCFLKIPP